MKNICVLSLSNSYYTLILLNRMRALGIKVSALILVELGLPALIKQAYKMYLKRLGPINTAYALCDRFMLDRIKRQSISRQKDLVTDYGKLAETIIYVDSFNSDSVVTSIKKINTDLLVLGQCLILKGNVLSAPNFATINGHAALLPYYRGNDVIHWTILNNDFDRLGITIHNVDTGIDTGSILSTKAVSIQQHETLYDLQVRMLTICAEHLAEVTFDYDKYSSRTMPQSKSDGKLYFAMPADTKETVRAHYEAHKESIRHNG